VRARMTSKRNEGAAARLLACTRRFISGATTVVMIGLSCAIPAIAESPKPPVVFAHKYRPLAITATALANPALLLRAPSFQAVIEQPAAGAARGNAQGLIGGIHQGAKAVAVGAAAGQRVRLEYRAPGQIILNVGDQSAVTGLSAVQARPMASLVERDNNALVTVSDPATHRGKRGFQPRLAESYLDTAEGYWLLWADAISEDLFYRTDFAFGDFPDGSTIVDSNHPVTIESGDRLEVRGGEPWVAFWKIKGEKRGRILRYDDFLRAMKPRDQDDVQAVEAVRRVFKWAPVMRLAALSDPAAFQSFVRQLEQIKIAPVATPRLLIEE
jgi:hypothetical protein